MRSTLLLALALATAGCTAGSMAQPAHPVMATGVVSTPVARTGRTISDQPLRLPQGDAEVVAAAVEIAEGGALPVHQHPWSRFVYVERGAVRVVNHDTGASNDFTAGQFFPEVIGQWHEGRAIGSGGTRLIVIDLVPPGVSNVVMRN